LVASPLSFFAVFLFAVATAKGDMIYDLRGLSGSITTDGTVDGTPTILAATFSGEGYTVPVATVYSVDPLYGLLYATPQALFCPWRQDFVLSGPDTTGDILYAYWRSDYPWAGYDEIILTKVPPGNYMDPSVDFIYYQIYNRGTYDSAPMMVAVPEPASLTLLSSTLLGLAGAFYLRRHRAKARRPRNPGRPTGRC
jgi:hypothetical protein